MHCILREAIYTQALYKLLDTNEHSCANYSIIAKTMLLYGCLLIIEAINSWEKARQYTIMSKC